MFILPHHIVFFCAGMILLTAAAEIFLARPKYVKAYKVVAIPKMLAAGALPVAVNFV